MGVPVGGCCLGVYFGIWTRRTAWEVKERGEWERREFHAEGIVVGVEEEFVGGDFFNGGDDRGAGRGRCWLL